MPGLLLVGVGNTLRSDDGVGAYVVQRIAALHYPGVNTVITQQVHVEHLADWMDYSLVVLVDASSRVDSFEYSLVKIPNVIKPSSSHHVSAELLVSLAKEVFKKDLNLALCAIKGHNFDVGEQLTEQTAVYAKEAIDYLCTKVISQNK